MNGFRRIVSIGVATAFLATGIGVATSFAGATSLPGWTVSLPNLISSTPNYEFPYASSQFYSQTNTNDFQELQYRPLYWFGGANSIAVNPAESLAAMPIFTGGNKIVTVNLKSGLKWSTGETVTSANVMFWLNLLAAVPSGWANYTAPLNGKPIGIPDIINSIVVPSPSSIVFHLNTAVSPQWFLYNELSQITPLPQSWDIIPTGWAPNTLPTYTTSLAVSQSSGSLSHTSAVNNCPVTKWIGDANTGPTSTFKDVNGLATVVSSSQVIPAQYCTEVYSLMSSYAADTNNYANTNSDTYRLFQVTDGPWHLTSYNLPQGSYGLSRSLTYQGPITGTAKNINFIPCSSEQACYSLVLKGTLTQGALPMSYAKAVTNLSQVASAQPSQAHNKGYKLVVNDPWSSNYALINEASTQGPTGDNGKILSLTYVRQALNEVSDQALAIKKFLKGLGYATTGPVPSQPVNPLSSSLVSPALPFSISKAKTLLLANGWNIVGGAMTCVKPGSLKGDCGPGVKVSDTLNFQLMYSNDSVPEQQVNQLFQSTCAAIGIKIVLKAASLDSVLGMISTAGTTTWDLADWGNGWIYTPRYYPSGETLFATGAVSNAGTYSNAAADKYISGTVFGGITLTQYNKYLALSDPVIYHPNAVTLLEVKSAVKGFSANPLGTMTPENWSE